MPRYFFHLRAQADLIEDTEGMELPDLNAALAEAQKTDRELMACPAGIYGLEFEIRDSSGKHLLTVPIQERRRHRSLTSSAESDQRRRHDDTPRVIH